MARKAEGRKISLKSLLPLVMIYVNYQIDYKSENTLKVIRFLFMVSLSLVRSPRRRSGGVRRSGRAAFAAAAEQRTFPGARARADTRHGAGQLCDTHREEAHQGGERRVAFGAHSVRDGGRQARGEDRAGVRHRRHRHPQRAVHAGARADAAAPTRRHATRVRAAALEREGLRRVRSARGAYRPPARARARVHASAHCAASCADVLRRNWHCGRTRVLP